MYTLLYLKWITNKDLLYSTRNTVQQHTEPCSMLCASLDGRGVWGRMDICMCMAEFLETTTTLLIGSTLCCAYSVVSNSLRFHRLQPARLVCLSGFSRQEYWSGLPYPPPGDLPNPGIKPRCPALQVDSLPSEAPGKPRNTGVGSLSLLPDPGIKLGFPVLQADSLAAELQGKPLAIP